MCRAFRTSKLALGTAPLLMVFAAVLAACVDVTAQCADSTPDVIDANGSRPTLLDAADINQYGDAEVDYAWAVTWQQSGVHHNTFEGVFKLVVLCDLELHWTQDTFVSQATPGRKSTHGFGDQLAGFQYRVHRQGKYVPTIAGGYDIKVPTASARLGLGSGQSDHNLSLLASKDFGAYHFDLNETAIFSGRSDRGGYDRNSFTGVAGSHPLYHSLAITAEIYSFTRQNSDTAGYRSTLWGVTYNLTPRLVLQSAIDIGLSSGAPHKSVIAGFTYRLSDFRSALNSFRHP
jgi:hypothetical protein